MAFRAGDWQKARMEQQMHEWFGEVPDYIIILAADYCAQCGDAEFCALVEHELIDAASQPAEVANQGVRDMHAEAGITRTE